MLTAIRNTDVRLETSGPVPQLTAFHFEEIHIDAVEKKKNVYSLVVTQLLFAPCCHVNK